MTKTKKVSRKYTEFFDRVTAVLPARSGDILRRRFGMLPGQPSTLDGIGKHYNLTRERIRQVVDAGIAEVREHLSEKDKKVIYLPLEEEIKKRGYIMPEEELVKIFAKDDPVEAGAIRFFLEVSDKIDRMRHSDVEKTVVHVDFNQQQWERVKDIVMEILNETRKPLSHEELHEKYVSHRKSDKKIDPKRLHHYLQPVKDIKQNPFGRWGLSHWRDVTPRAVREKIYLVLNEHKEPLHFSEIAEHIDKHGLSKRPGQKTNVQTVHNELIKDSRFILVGRGRYALRDWGYTPGTVKDIIEQILTEAGKPLPLRKIVEEVLKVRDVRETTVVVNLNSFFKKVKRGVYTLPDEKK